MAAGALLAALFALGVGLRLHGFSISIWRDWTDGSPAGELLLGRPQLARIDDFAVILPLALAQERHEPPFPVVNTNIGLGHNMLLPFSLPVWHPVALFKPDSWGFFLGADVGMAWRWWSRALGLTGAAWLLLLVVTGGDRALSAAGALLLFGSPFYQFWALRPAPVTIHAVLVVLGALAVTFARRRAAIVLAGLVLGYAAVGFALTLYPAFQVPLATLALVLFGALVFVHRGRLDLRARLGWRLGAALLAALVVAAGAALFLGAAGDAFERMRHTAYPGNRVSVGGNRPVAALFAADVGVPLLTERYGPLLNACEAAGFWLLSPALVAAALARAAAQRRRPDALVVALASAWLALVAHAAIGIPAWLARASGWSYVPGHRSVIALGVADVLLLARLLADPVLVTGAARAGLALGWAAVVAGCGAVLSGRLGGLPAAGVAIFVAANAALVWLALVPRRPWHALAAAAAASWLVAGWFNPLVRGGADAVQGNALARAVEEVDAASGGHTVWVAFDNPGLGNLFRAVGVRSVNGVQPVPQLELWRTIDPDGSDEEAYNRYAHVLFGTSADLEPRFERTAPDAFRIYVAPTSPALQKLGVTHLVLDAPQARRLAERGGAMWLRSAGRHHILREPWAPVPAVGDAASAAAPAREEAP